MAKQSKTKKIKNPPTLVMPTQDELQHPNKKWLILFVALVIFFIALAPYIQTSRFGFVGFDDSAYVKDNFHVLSGFSINNLIWALTTDEVCNWHPLTWISLQLDVSLFGGGPGTHHTINFLFHAVNCCLLFLILCSLTREIWASAFVAAIFAVHPLHVESVAWISERKDVLSGFFWLLTIASYIWCVRRFSIWRYLTICVCLALGLMAKPMLVTMPAALLLLDYWPLNRFEKSGARRCLLEKIPLMGLVLLSSFITFVVQRSGGGVVTVDAIPLWARFANVPVAYIRYVFMTFWPLNLGIHYPHLRAAIPLWQPIIASCILVAITALVVTLYKKAPYLFVGWFWFLGVLVPVIGIVQVGDQALADRYSYVPHVGFFIAVTWLLLPYAKKSPKIAACIASVIIALLGFRAYDQTTTWRDTFALFENSLRVAPDNYHAHVGLGVAYADERRQYDKAIEHCKRAVEISPREASDHYNLGNALLGGGRIDEAINCYKKSIALNPKLPNTHYNYGLALARQKKYEEAISEFKETLKLQPDRAGAYNNLGAALTLLGKLEEAVPQYQKAVEYQPNDVDSLCNLAYALSKTNKIQDARSVLERASKLFPQNNRVKDLLKGLPGN